MSTNKWQLSRAAAERNEKIRARYRFRMGAEDPEHLVFIDESRIDIWTSYRLNGWSQKGTRARIQSRFQRGTG
ncbi:MAG TPA: hypothetical protein VGO47_10440 [Chlamydiales bacterium]|nr:hypothetical protein [Chlamydiales bacterium]